jgi:hypothetical protein
VQSFTRDGKLEKNNSNAYHVQTDFAYVVFNPLNQLLQGSAVIPFYKRNKYKIHLKSIRTLLFLLYSMLPLKKCALQAGYWWLTSIILATWKVEIGRIVI